MRTPIAAVVLLALVALPSYAAAAPPREASAPSTAGHVVWTNRAADGREALLIARADGSGRRALTRPGPGEIDTNAQFSPDGRWIAYERQTEESSSIRLVRPSGKDDHAVPVACVDQCLGAGGPGWLSSSTLVISLAFGPVVDDTAAEALLWTVRTDGTQLERLSPVADAGAFEEGYAHPTRDGRHLVFTRLRLEDGASALFRSDADGTDRHRITPWGLGFEISDVSTARSGPTKDLVLFESYGRGDVDATFVDLGTVPATCRTPRACRKALDWITDNEASGRRNANPHWAPNGRDYVFTDRADIDTEDVQIWTARYGGTARREISTSRRFDYRPDWG